MLAVTFAAVIGAGELRAFLSKSPAIVLENKDISQLDVGVPPPDLKLHVYLTFELHNFGNADGYAYVGFFINGSLYWSRTYLVKFGIVLPVEEVAAIECRLPDRCFDWGHVSDLRLVWTIRALFAS